MPQYSSKVQQRNHFLPERTRRTKLIRFLLLPVMQLTVIAAPAGQAPAPTICTYFRGAAAITNSTAVTVTKDRVTTQ